MRIYEELFIVKPDAPDEEVDQFIEQMKSVVTTAGGTVDKVDKWGKRRLAYRVDKYKEGAYVLFQFTSAPETVKEFAQQMLGEPAPAAEEARRIDMAESKR